MKSVPDRWTFEGQSFSFSLPFFNQTDQPSCFHPTEEVYHFRSDPRAVGGEVLLTVDPDSFDSSSSFFFSDAFLPLSLFQKLTGVSSSWIAESGNTSSDPSFSMGPGPHPIGEFATLSTRLFSSFPPFPLPPPSPTNLTLADSLLSFRLSSLELQLGSKLTTPLSLHPRPPLLQVDRSSPLSDIPKKSGR